MGVGVSRRSRRASFSCSSLSICAPFARKRVSSASAVFLLVALCSDFFSRSIFHLGAHAYTGHAETASAEGRVE